MVLVTCCMLLMLLTPLPGMGRVRRQASGNCSSVLTLRQCRELNLGVPLLEPRNKCLLLRTQSMDLGTAAQTHDSRSVGLGKRKRHILLHLVNHVETIPTHRFKKQEQTRGRREWKTAVRVPEV